MVITTNESASVFSCIKALAAESYLSCTCAFEEPTIPGACVSFSFFNRKKGWGLEGKGMRRASASGVTSPFRLSERYPGGWNIGRRPIPSPIPLAIPSPCPRSARPFFVSVFFFLFALSFLTPSRRLTPLTAKLLGFG